jgi:outer membrane protein assembly factor BamD (BamD/ComL family)
MQGRYRKVIQVARALLTLTPPPNYEQMVPSVQQYIITAYDQLKDYDAALAEGERFLQRYPTSPSSAPCRS